MKKLLFLVLMVLFAVPFVGCDEKSWSGEGGENVHENEAYLGTTHYKFLIVTDKNRDKVIENFEFNFLYYMYKDEGKLLTENFTEFCDKVVDNMGVKTDFFYTCWTEEEGGK